MAAGSNAPHGGAEPERDHVRDRLRAGAAQINSADQEVSLFEDEPFYFICAYLNI